MVSRRAAVADAEMLRATTGLRAATVLQHGNYEYNVEIKNIAKYKVEVTFYTYK